MEVVKGLDIILLYRLKRKAEEEEAWKMAFQTEHESSMTREAESTITKDGNVQSLNPIEYELTATSLMAKGDAHIDEMKKALIDGEVIEIWEINKAELGVDENKDKYKATYYQGYVSEFTPSANAEDNVELSLSFVINGIGQEGYASLTDKQAEVVQYTFTDTVANATTTEG
ncbi:TP901-1 family phage major tail protein [Enterococcus phoeniculicola]|jgi:TP901-1 family phage major tail protein|uniref:TP901-1 family phage major tail protein n=1 Tax=Enterococcus phoeniculicola ATCC BAA-412 TaxID=1158610 RepID=R3TJN0_9ENTE|nr:phage major tail protein, TP901-1 family [Enterococcus phoeniculicola]EOL41624.1 TP901-1 family phage major tail protein [Enterococcus phoeniculicola ATCC BAA-412]EOT78882.1 TP901-1 family phage major tail protein [Enterococcus phoeniculicola ATCC BAA-412]OJG72715.1 TP901-1 family phage major tail protein [Enterococcus phoeniculicola]